VSKTSPKVISHAGRSGALSPEMRDWPTEELLRIRLVFKRLTALRVKNPDDAEDLVQEALLTMTQKFPEIELHKGLMVWGMGILRRKVGNYYRRCRPPESLEQEAHSLRIATLLQAQPSAESGIRHSELLGLVGRILRRFPPNERVVMDLVLDGLPTNEIVDLLSPERYQNVVNRIYRARKKLQRALAKHGYEVPQACTKNRGRKAALSSRS